MGYFAIDKCFNIPFSISGLKSYGKVVYLFSLVPVFGMLLFCSKLLGFMPADPKFQFLFPETEWSEFFLNTKVKHTFIYTIPKGFVVLTIKVRKIPVCLFKSYY